MFFQLCVVRMELRLQIQMIVHLQQLRHVETESAMQEKLRRVAIALVINIRKLIHVNMLNNPRFFRGFNP